jgi:hypothetical protein
MHFADDKRTILKTFDIFFRIFLHSCDVVCQGVLKNSKKVRRDDRLKIKQLIPFQAFNPNDSGVLAPLVGAGKKLKSLVFRVQNWISPPQTGVTYNTVPYAPVKSLLVDQHEKSFRSYVYCIS